VGAIAPTPNRLSIFLPGRLGQSSEKDLPTGSSARAAALHGRTFDRQEIDTSERLLSNSRAGEIDTRTVEAHSLKKPVQRSIP
jgi:hypothetical protein